MHPLCQARSRAENSEARFCRADSETIAPIVKLNVNCETQGHGKLVYIPRRRFAHGKFRSGTDTAFRAS